MESHRASLIECLTADEDAFSDRLTDAVETHDIDGVDPGAEPSVPEDLPESVLGDLTPFERRMVARMDCFDTAPLGLTLTGPAYQDNPVRYATTTFRELTGYSLSDLRGENLRLLQGPDTEGEAVADLYEAIDIWEQMTVELWNYRKDGTRFRNRVTVVPLHGPDGTITNWLGVQEDVTGEG
jgi:PAS domain S-box-containing protein